MSGFVEVVSTVNAQINSVVWGPIMLTLLIGTGLLLSIRMGFPQFTKFSYVMKNTIGSLFNSKQHKKDDSGVSPFQAVATAMAGTIGTGSITGIANLLDVDQRSVRDGNKILRNHFIFTLQRKK